MTSDSRSNILSGKACRRLLLRIPCTCSLFLFFGQISLGINCLQCPSSDMATYGHWDLLISCSCVCHQDSISSDSHHPQQLTSQFMLLSLLSTMEQRSWLKNRSFWCLSHQHTRHASLNYASSMAFVKYSSWWPRHITSCIPPNMPRSLSLRSSGASVNVTQLSLDFWNHLNIRFSWHLGFFATELNSMF